MNCGKQCGHCRENDCHHKSGTCIVGCMAGYQGNLCLKRMYIYKSTVKTTLSP